MNNTITRAMLADRASDATEIKHCDVCQIAQRMFELVGSALREGDSVKLTGFGSLQIRSRAERVGRNPRTGEEHRIAPRHAVIFIPGARLRAALDGMDQIRA
ncbi:HU family DNA-binding protein [Devosia faecipullorum]|uniref:HU family DNA-binding protein n=1 Tax=Devosia faecipullorum TaxID=2755039 RepID=UPI00187B5588|nr:HU family DNA-binding protein [Devosia faecipullorum]